MKIPACPLSTRLLAIVLLAIPIIFSCASVRHVRPMARGESALSVSLGGPVAKQVYGPLPLLSVGYNRGLIGQRLDMEVGAHLTQIAFGIAMLDGGVNWHVRHARGLFPGIMLSPRLFVMSDFSPDGARLYPCLGMTANWKIGASSYLYAGLDNWFEPRSTRADGFSQQYHWLIAPMAGLSIGHGLWQYQLEARVFAPNVDNRGRGAKYIGIGNYGAVGMFLGLSRTLGGSR